MFVAVAVEAERDGKWSSCSHNAVEMVAEEEGPGDSKAAEVGGGGGDGGCCLVFCCC